MKTTINIAAKRAILISILFLGFQIHNGFAKLPANNGPAKNFPLLTAIAPVTPKEATFDDIPPEKASFMILLAPITPKEATFEEDDTVAGFSAEFLHRVAPVTPAEADFSDSSPDTGYASNAEPSETLDSADNSDF